MPLQPWPYNTSQTTQDTDSVTDCPAMAALKNSCLELLQDERSSLEACAKMASVLESECHADIWVDT